MQRGLITKITGSTQVELEDMDGGQVFSFENTADIKRSFPRGITVFTEVLFLTDTEGRVVKVEPYDKKKDTQRAQKEKELASR